MKSKPLLVVLSGAGISAESGIPTFRASDGLWENHRVEDVASPQGWAKNPQLVQDFYNQRRRQIRSAQPNPGHRTLAELEGLFAVNIITQNIDDLHERAGSRSVLHLHGEILKARSSEEENLIYNWTEDITSKDRCAKGFPLRPHIVWFGEAVPMMEAAVRLAAKADVFLVVGTSLAVYPAASLVHYVADAVPKYLIDPVLPEGIRLPRLEHIALPAGTGLPLLFDRWKVQLPV